MLTKLLIGFYDIFISKVGVFVLIASFISYKYGYPLYQDYQIKKIEIKIRENIGEYVFKYKINIPAPPNEDILKYYSMDLKAYPEVKLYYRLDGDGREDFVEYLKKNFMVCWFWNYVYGDEEYYQSLAMKNVLGDDKVKFSHIILNRSGDLVGQVTQSAKDCPEFKLYFEKKS